MSAPFDPGRSLNEAVALHREGRLRDAEKIYARVLKAAPDHFDALNLLGTVKAQLGRMGEAHRLLSAAVKINPRAADAFVNLAHVLHALGRDQEALQNLDKARALAPDDADVLNHHANALLSLGRAEEALGEFGNVLARAPNHAAARLNGGIALALLGRAEDALAEFDRALVLMPGHPATQYNRGIALHALGRYSEAVEANDRALAAVPDHAGALLNRGLSLAALNRYHEALDSYGKLTALRKDNADAHFNAALALLTLGDYRRGFAEYEWRWQRTGMPPQRRGQGRPLWLGEYPLARKTILVHAEQGFGDTIQFARYVPQLAAAGAKVVLEVPAVLTALLAKLEGAAAVIAHGETPPPFDVHCPLGSLPLALQTELATVPAPIPYLAADDAYVAKWSNRLGGIGRPRIAIAWSGNPSHANDRNRSIAFSELAPLFEGAAHFVSLQREVRAADAQPLAAETRVTQLGDALENFADTAAVIALCDLVIAVDTAAAHLAGAMGRPLWVMLPFAPDWRWTLLGESSPWYPKARLFRQPALGDWQSVVARVAAELASVSATA